MDDAATGKEPAERGRPGPVAEVDLADGRRLVVRAAGRDDLDAVEALYGRLSTDDLRLRFFVGHAPPTGTTMRWLTGSERGGLAMVAEVVEHDGSTLVVAEAGFALLDDGDGELAITVDPRWRGWLGGWLLDLLVDQAAHRGIPNLQAEVMVQNRTMLALLRHRGHAVVTHPDWETIRLVISTEGYTPGWPPRSERPHLLVTAAGGRWRGETAAEEAGFEVRTCPGPGGRDRPCPLATGERCPLLDGADAVVLDLVPRTPETADLADTLAGRGIPLVVTRRGGDDRSAGPCQRAADIVEQLADQLLDRPADPTGDPAPGPD